jgi:Group II intron, maturase-specific domain/Reverse transcriptase (RNA-dependent DNA polymerase)
MSPCAGNTPWPFQPPVTQRDIEAEVIHCVGGVTSPLLANIYLHVPDTEFTRRGLGELVRYADDGVTLCRSAAQARAALAAVCEILASLGLELHPDKTKVVDLRQGREGLDFLGCHFRARMSGRVRERYGKVRYYLHRWPSRRAMKRLRGKIRDRTGRNRVGRDIREVIADLNPLLRGWGNYFRTGNAAGKFRQADEYVVFRLCSLMVKKRGRNLRAGQAWVWTEGVVQRARPVSAARHRPLSEGSVTMPGRSSVSRMRENRTYGLKGGWGNRPARALRP